jgi:hypothetical protein
MKPLLSFGAFLPDSPSGGKKKAKLRRLGVKTTSALSSMNKFTMPDLLDVLGFGGGMTLRDTARLLIPVNTIDTYKHISNISFHPHQTTSWHNNTQQPCS